MVSVVRYEDVEARVAGCGDVEEDLVVWLDGVRTVIEESSDEVPIEGTELLSALVVYMT